MAKLSPHISLRFNGDCEAAFRFYEQSLDAKIAFLLAWADSPMAAQAPAGWERKILYGRLTLGDTDLAGADVLPEQYKDPSGFSILLNLDDPEYAERMFAALAEGGAVQMPLQKTFWAARYGGVTDRFGVPWEINCEQAG
jgi:PhnB protein